MSPQLWLVFSLAADWAVGPGSPPLLSHFLTGQYTAVVRGAAWTKSLIYWHNIINYIHFNTYISHKGWYKVDISCIRIWRDTVKPLVTNTIKLIKTRFCTRHFFFSHLRFSSASVPVRWAANYFKSIKIYQRIWKSESMLCFGSWLRNKILIF